VRIEKAPFQIREIISDVVATFGDTAARKGVVLGVDIDPQAPEWLMGDALRIQQVLVNLLSNALKFTTAGLVHLRVKILEAQGSGDPRLRYEVLDTGPGISPEDQDKVFLKFIQLPNQTASQRGTGLGLTICRDLVELMGGKIGVSSPAGGGSNFYFHLPLELAPGGSLAPPPPSLEAPSSGKLPDSNRAVRILVAEDTEDNRLLLEHYLQSERVELRFAFTGREAVDLIEHGEQFDLILMDIDMPVLDGYGAARAIRLWEKMHAGSTPIVALSADAMSEAVRSSLDAGCVAHVAKPIDRATLLSTIQRYATPSSGRPNMPVPTPTASVSPEVRALVLNIWRPNKNRSRKPATV
jgi:CheY-like chemotaxis protein